MSEDELIGTTIIGVIFLGLIALVLFYLFFLPTFIAFRRGHRNRWVIFLINFVFGATVLGWIGALIWALTASQTHDPNAYGQNDALGLTPRHDDTLQQAKTLTRPCLDCGEPILLVARKCKHCGSAVAPIGAEPSGATPLPESRPTVGGAARLFCSECGSQMPESDKFCQKCGAAQEPLSR